MKNTTLIILLFFPLLSFSQDYQELNDEFNPFIKNNDYTKAIPLLKKAARMGDPEAQYILGNCYRNGTGVGYDQKKAAELYIKAAQKNFNKALMAIANCYLYGDGVEQNYDKAFLYALQCAKNGTFDCISGLVSLYIKEIGTKSNSHEILKWSLILSRNNFTDDKFYNAAIILNRLKIARLYKKGEKLEQDDFNSYVWYLKYNELKRVITEYEQKKAIVEIKELDTKLTSKQKHEAKLKAEKLLGRSISNVENLYNLESSNKY